MGERKPFDWINEATLTYLQRGYLSEGEDAQTRIKTIAQHAEKLLDKPGFADKFYENMSKGWYSLSTPVWANFGKKRGLPVSCFGSYYGDNIESILFSQAEVGEMSKMGGGTSGYFGDIRGRGEQITDNGDAPGAVHFMNLPESTVDIISQGKTRRGRFSPYLPIDHKDFDEFMDIGTEEFPIQDLTHGVTVSDEFMEKMIDGDKEARRRWAKVLQRRSEMGYPYIFYSDTVNMNAPQVYKDKAKKILASNLCSEICLSSNEEESFVCVLSSMNLLHYDEWKGTDAVEILTMFLDAVVTEFCNKLEELRDNGTLEGKRAFFFMERAYNFAKSQRALGLGVLGWHSLLQSKSLPFDSKESSRLNIEVFKLLQQKTEKATKQLAKEYGEPSLLKGYSRRNATCMALAPTQSSAFILGQVSNTIEPIWSNCYVDDKAKIKITIKNKVLEKLLEEKGKNITSVWSSIKKQDGSVQHLDFLSDHEKEVFKTFFEINQSAIITQAGIRQDYIDQSQSLNLLVDPDMPIKDVNKLLIDAWRMGVKTLYYQHSMNAAQAFSRKKMGINDMECLSCQG
jgi:ribonucleoside-diphosphate reductase alpha chain